MTSASNSLRQQATQRNLRYLLLQDIAHRSGVGLDGVRPRDITAPLSRHWKDQIRIASRRLSAGEYEFTPYKEILISKGAGRPPRVLSIPTVRDRLALRVLTNVLNECLPTHSPGVAQLKARSVYQALSGYDAYVRVDIKDYFPSIAHDTLLGILRRYIKSAPVLRMVEEAIRTPTVARGPAEEGLINNAGVPQGLALSTVLAELYLHDLSSRWRSESSLRFYKYVDDIVVLCECRDVNTVATRLSDQLDEMGLTIHPVAKHSKSHTGLISDGFGFLGYQFYPSMIEIGHEAIRHMEEQLGRVFSEYRRRRATPSQHSLEWLDWHTQRLICGCIYQGEHRGWLRFYSNTRNVAQLQRLDAVVATLARRSQVPTAFVPKKFVRAYFLTRSPGTLTTYIPEPEGWSIGVVRDHLVFVEGLSAPYVHQLSESVARGLLRRSVLSQFDQLERDIDPRS